MELLGTLILLIGYGGQSHLLWWSVGRSVSVSLLLSTVILVMASCTVLFPYIVSHSLDHHEKRIKQLSSLSGLRGLRVENGRKCRSSLVVGMVAGMSAVSNHPPLCTLQFDRVGLGNIPRPIILSTSNTRPAHLIIKK